MCTEYTLVCFIYHFTGLTAWFLETEVSAFESEGTIEVCVMLTPSVFQHNIDIPLDFDNITQSGTLLNLIVNDRVSLILSLINRFYGGGLPIAI